MVCYKTIWEVVTGKHLRKGQARDTWRVNGQASRTGNGSSVAAFSFYISEEIFAFYALTAPWKH